MKQQNKIILIVLLALLAVAIVIFLTKYRIVSFKEFGKTKFRIEKISGTLKVMRDFAVKDTASIDKIFMADKQNNTILLERKSNNWRVNGDYIARRDFVDVLLETICKIEVAAPVPKSKMDYVLRSLSTSSVKVEIYQAGKLAKVYYVGGVTQNNTGTFMLLEGSEEPFEIHIPGFAGFLNTRYITNLYEWRDRILFDYKVNEIKSVSLEFPSNHENSFTAVSNGNNNYSIVLAKTGKALPGIDQMAVKEFMSRYKRVGFEIYLNDVDEYLKLDSILNSKSEICIYTVEDIKGKKTRVKTYPRPNFKNTYDEEGHFYNNDIDRFYGVINNNKDLIMLQYINFDLLTKNPDDFLAN